MTRIVSLLVFLGYCLVSICLGAKRGDLPLLKVDIKSPTQDVSLIDVMEANIYANELSSMCEENIGHRCVHFTECDEEGYWDPNLVTFDMFDVRFGNKDHLNDICPEENQVCYCPLGWELWEQSCYYFAPSQYWMTWNQAKEECSKLNNNSSLPSINSLYEDQFVQNNTLGTTFWLGAYRHFAANYKELTSWQWADGSNMTWAGWADGQPNNYWFGERCIRSVNQDVQDLQPTWDDHRCWLKSANALVCKLLPEM